MDTIINRLIQLNVEIEGALRTAAARKSPQAIDMAKEKFDEFSRLFTTLHADIEQPADEKEEELNEVKLDEAIGGETSPINEPDLAEVPANATVVESDNDIPAPISVDEKYLKSDIRKAFTLNDKFRFRRELFGNNDAEFNDTLDLIATMHSFEEAEEYIYDDLQWDRKDETVAEFMTIINGFFSNRK